MQIRWEGSGGSQVTDASVAKGRRSVSAALPTLGNSPLERELPRAGVEVAIVQDVRGTARRSVDTTPTLDFAVDSAPGEHAITILRHTSGALTFHAPDGVSTAQRGGRAAPTAAGDIKLAKANCGDLEEPGRRCCSFTARSPTPGARSRNCFGLRLFAGLRKRYQNRISALRTFQSQPDAYARMRRRVLEHLPGGAHSFDVVAYSRGGLVLRTMTELPGSAGASAARFYVASVLKFSAVPAAAYELLAKRRRDAIESWLVEKIAASDKGFWHYPSSLYVCVSLD